MAFTRRTHVVRIYDNDTGDKGGDFVDVEVLDAIAFRKENGQEVILNMVPANSSPHIVDETGGGHGKQPGKPTQLTHMQRVVGKKSSNKLDIEVVDAMAFRDQNGEEWILNAKDVSADPSVFDTTTGSGAGKATRRTHKEKISVGFVKNASEYLTVERCDAISFRTTNGKEVIFSCPSSDDPNGSDPRAGTFISSPTGYDPTNPTGPEPPKNTDAHNYVSFVAGADGFLTDDARIAQGPFWWIRNVTAGDILFVEVSYFASNPTSMLDNDPTVQLLNPYGPRVWDVLNKVDQLLPGIGNPPPIKNPVTDAMLSSYYQWTPVPKVETHSDLSTSPDVVYYLLRPGANIPFPITSLNYLDQIVVGHQAFTGNPIFATLVDFAGGVFDSLLVDNGPGSLYDIAIKNGFDINRIYKGINLWSSKEAADYAQNAYAVINNIFNANNTSAGTIPFVTPFQTVVTLPLSSSSQASTRAGTAIFEMNISQVKAAVLAATPARPGATSVDLFKIAVTLNSPSGSVSVTAKAYKKLRNFTLDKNNAPTFTPWDPPETAGAWGKQGSGSTTFNATITASLNLKTLDITFAIA
jgi:hypothetical protein